MKQYRIAEPGAMPHGPYAETMVKRAFERGLYPEGTLIWSEDMPRWQPIEEFFTPKRAEPPPLPAGHSAPPVPPAQTSRSAVSDEEGNAPLPRRPFVKPRKRRSFLLHPQTQMKTIADSPESDVTPDDSPTNQGTATEETDLEESSSSSAHSENDRTESEDTEEPSQSPSLAAPAPDKTAIIKSFNKVDILFWALLLIGIPGGIIWRATNYNSPEVLWNRALDYAARDNMAESAELIEKAAEKGHAQAQLHLAHAYAKGEIVTQSHQWAFYWFMQAAEQGVAEAQYELGNCYYDGQGVAQSYRKAVSWYRKAAEQNHAWGLRNLGVCYELGTGVSQSRQIALNYYKKAKEAGADVEADLQRDKKKKTTQRNFPRFQVIYR